MKINNIFTLLFAVGTMSAITACIEDESIYGGTSIPTLTVSVPGSGSGEMPEININYGEECVITPRINYDGASPLSYEWSAGTYDNEIKGPLEVVSNEPELRYSFPSGGCYYVQLNVTDGAVGIVQEYQVNVNRTFEQGYMIVSSDANGIGNLAFIKDLTAEDREQGITSIVLEHCVERVNESIGEENIAGVTILRMSWPADITRIVASYGSKSYFLDPNSFTAIASINHNDVIPGFKATKLIGGTNAIVHDASSNRYITLMGSDMIGVEQVSESAYTGFKYDVYSFYSYYAYGTQNYENYFATRSPLEVSCVTYSGVRSSNDFIYDGAPVFNGHSFNNLFVGETASCTVDYGWGASTVQYNPGYAISRQDATGKYFFTRMRQDENFATLTMQGHGEIPTNANTAIPDVGSDFAVSNKYHRTYYRSDNKVYVMLTSEDNISWPDRDQYALSFPADEEITYMTIRTDTDELIIATADKSSGRGNVYIFNIADVRTDSPGTAPTTEYKDCADRISYIVYKPRIVSAS